MKRVSLTLAAALVLIAGGLAYRTVAACGAWQERYRRLVYLEMMKNSPIIYTPEEMDELAGGRPFGCDRPGWTLTESDVERFRRSGVSP